MKRFAAALLFLSAALRAQGTTNAPSEASKWEPLQFLLGTWEAKTSGGSAGADSSGSYTFQSDLGGHVLARHTSSDSCKGPAGYDCQHRDLLYIYQDSPGGPLKAIYFDSENHVIHYDVTTPAANTALFTSPASQTGPQFRLIYELTGRTMRGRFQLKTPGQSEFKSYLEWSGPKK